jgi:hypothetical protein
MGDEVGSGDDMHHQQLNRHLSFCALWLSKGGLHFTGKQKAKKEAIETENWLGRRSSI